jgi:hypothetical protein
MNNVSFAAIVAISSLFFVSAAQAANPSFETISRCFFVYAQIFEAGEKLTHQELFQFGQARIGWVGGYVQANQSNPEFKRIFDGNLAANKRAGLELGNSLMKAMASRNRLLFSAVINEAISCDRLIGISTNFIPEM